MVQFNTPVEEEDVWGMVNGRSIKALSFSIETEPGSKDYIARPLGTIYSIVTTESLQKRQATAYGDGNELKFYPDGKPIFDLIATGSTEYADPEDPEDDGTRRLYFTGTMRRALQDEMRAKGITRFGIGTKISVKLTGFKPNPKGKPSKLFDVTVVPTEWVSPDQLATEQALGAASGPGEQWSKTAPAARAVDATPAAAVAQPPVQDLAALMALAAANTAAAAPEVPKVGATQIDQVSVLVKAGIDRAAAISAVAENAFAGDTAYRTALDNEIPF